MSDDRLHVLEFGLRWPPETFIGAKLRRLGAQGMRISVASTGSAESTTVRNVEVLGVIATDVRSLDLRTRARGLWSLIVLLASRPRRAFSVLGAAGLPTAAGKKIGGRERRARQLAYAQLARRRPDVIHFEWESAAVDYLSLIDALGVPGVVSCRGRPLAQVIRPSRQRIAQGLAPVFDRAAAVHCVAEAVRREAVALGLDAGKALVITGAVDSEYFSPRLLPRRANEKLRVVSVGHLRWLKGYEYTLLAIATLVRDGIPVTLEIIGSDPSPEVDEVSELSRIRRAADYLGVADRVRVLGALGHEQVRSHLQQADALLHMSLTEGLPNVLLEAMACGLPVVATDVGGTSEAVRDGVDGLLIAPRDPAAAARALAALWGDRGLRERMGRAARARVKEQFTPECQTKGWMKLYAQVVHPEAAS